MRCGRWIVLLAVACAPAVVRAESAGSAPELDALAVKQQMIRDRIARLEDRMFRLREKLATSEPQNAQRLEAALEQAGALDLNARVEALAERLHSQGALDASIEEQEKLLGDLEALLGVLLDRNPDDARRREELKRLAEIKANLDSILREQLEQRQAAARRVQAQRLAGRLESAARELGELKEAQDNLKARTSETDPADARKSEAQAGEQESLAERAERLRRELEQLARRHAELRPQPEEGAQPSGEPKDGKPQIGEPKDGDKQPAGPLDDAAKDVESSKQDMRQAAQDQREGDPRAAEKEQDEALEKLTRAIHRLQEAQKELEKQAEDEQAAGDQRKTADDTGKLARKMKSGSSSGGQKQQDDSKPQGQPGENQQQGQQSGDQPQDQKPTPGQENVERAEQHMDDAAEKLDGQDTDKAILEQDKALDELERAKRELEETLKQLRQEEQEEILASLENRLNDMLAKQTAINQETLPLHELGAENFARGETLKCAELSTRQQDIREAAGMGVRLLEEDGTTVVFPNILRQLEEDARTIASRLGESNVGPLTVAMQEDVRATLAELLESLKKLREDMKNQKPPAGGAPGGGAPAGAPLVPTSAELKLLKSSQTRINRQTLTAEESEADETAAILERAAAQQADLLEMTREIQERAEKEMGP